jgi:hypothetical protein
MDAQTVGGGYGRSLVFQTSARVSSLKKPRKWPEKTFSAAARTLALSVLYTWFPPPTLEVTGDLDWEESRDGRSGFDLGAGLPGCDRGIEERPTEEGFFASLYPLSPARPKLCLSYIRLAPNSESSPLSPTPYLIFDNTLKLQLSRPHYRLIFTHKPA